MVQVDESQSAALDGYVDKEVIFGIRPEDVEDVANLESFNPAHQLTAKVEVVEPMGAEIFLYLNTGKHTFIARVDAHDLAKEGQSLNMVCDMSKSHFFEANDAGKTIV